MLCYSDGPAVYVDLPLSHLRQCLMSHPPWANMWPWRCSIGIAEQSTFRATKGLLTSGLTSPTSVKETDRREQIDAVNSQGNVQRGQSCAPSTATNPLPAVRWQVIDMQCTMVR